MPTLRQDIESVINRHGAEKESDTPDYILAGYLTECLVAFNRAARRSKAWHDRDSRSATSRPATPESEADPRTPTVPH